MPPTHRILGATLVISLLSVSPALGAQSGVATVSMTGGALALAGLALIAVGAWMLARTPPRSNPAPERDAVLDARREDLGPMTSRQARNARLALPSAGVEGDGSARAEQVYAPVGAAERRADGEEIDDLLTAGLGSPGATPGSDRDAMAAQMLAALREERTRRGR